MNKRKSKNSFKFLLVLIVIISVGFAYLSTTVFVNGLSKLMPFEWDIHFENIDILEGSVELAQDDSEPEIGDDDLSINFSVTFDEPGDYYWFSVDVVNDGTLDARITAKTFSNLSALNEKSIDYDVFYANGDPLEPDFILMRNSRKTLIVAVRYSQDLDTEDLPTSLRTIDFSMSITYQQADENSIKTSTFIEGVDVANKMRILSGTTAEVINMNYNNYGTVMPKYLNDINNPPKVEKLSNAGELNVKAFRHATELEEGLTDNNIVSVDDADVPIYMWFEEDEESGDGTGTIYWYSDADIVYLNPMSAAFFTYFVSDSDSISYALPIYLEDISGLEPVNASKVENMSFMFGSCVSLSNFSALENWDVSNVIDFSEAFAENPSLEDLDFLENWNVSSGQTFASMFNECENLADVSGLSKWDLSNTITLNSMFRHCDALASLVGLEYWDVSSVEDMSSMFSFCNIDSITPLKRWKTISLYNMTHMFSNCNNLISIYDLKDWNVTSVRNMSYLFYGCGSLASLSGLDSWIVFGLKNLNYAFCGCTSLTSALELSSWSDYFLDSYNSTFDGTNIDTEQLPSWYTRH